ncbi:MAG: hypothetical protein JWQ40_1372 [Segetibacter sp.]|nr:hypothetical protein [Segetibacter sp.]
MQFVIVLVFLLVKEKKKIKLVRLRLLLQLAPSLLKLRRDGPYERENDTIIKFIRKRCILRNFIGSK